MLDRLLALQDTHDRLGDELPSFSRGSASKIRVGCLKSVHHDSVFTGGDLSVENLKPLTSHHAGDLRYDARGDTIVGNHGVLADTQFFVKTLLDQHLSRLQPFDCPQVGCDPLWRSPIEIP